MQAQRRRPAGPLWAALVLLSVILAAATASAAPYAAFVMDARNGEVIFARNHDTRLHPASLTKMMTIYVAFEAIKHGEITLDTQFTVSQRAAGTACVCLGLRPGQRISVRHLIRASALRSANDATVVLAEGISGSVEAFAERMTRTARAIGMNNTTFRNPHGLTQAGHVSTARDMSLLGRQLYFDYPEYYNLFSRRSEDAGVARVPNTNTRFLDAYAGADGIKTGFTRAAGFNLTASAQRGGKHIIATMFGGTSTAARNAHVAELLDIGFSRAPTRVAVRAPRTPAYQGRGNVAVAAAPAAPAARAPSAEPSAGGSAKTIRLQRAVRTSPRPLPRPIPGTPAPTQDLLIAVAESVATAVAQSPAPVAPESLPVTPPAREEVLAAAAEPSEEDVLALAEAAGFSLAAPEDIAAFDPGSAESATEEAPTLDVAEAQPEPSVIVPALRPVARPDSLAVAQAAAPEPAVVSEATLALANALPVSLNVDLDVAPTPPPAPAVAPDAGIILTTSRPSRAEPDTTALATVMETHVNADPERVISRTLSTSDTGRIWGVSLGAFNSRAAAERSLITVKMAEANSLANGVSRIRQTSGRFEAVFAGLTETEAERACLRLTARAVECEIARP